MSAPAAKAFSEPVTIITRTFGSASQASNTCASASSSGVLSAFNASGRFRVAMPTASLTSVSTTLISISLLAFGTIKGAAPGLHDTLDLIPASQFAGFAFAAIDQEMMLEFAQIAIGPGIVAQGRAASIDGVLQHF